MTDTHVGAGQPERVLLLSLLLSQGLLGRKASDAPWFGQGVGLRVQQGWLGHMTWVRGWAGHWVPWVATPQPHLPLPALHLPRRAS